MMKKHVISLLWSKDNEEEILNNFLGAMQYDCDQVVSINTEKIEDRYFMTVWIRTKKFELDYDTSPKKTGKRFWSIFERQTDTMSSVGPDR